MPGLPPYHGTHVTELLEGIHLAGGLHGDGGLVEVHGHDVAGLEDVAEAVGAFAGIQFAGGDAVAEENAGETFGQDQPAWSNRGYTGWSPAFDPTPQFIAIEDARRVFEHIQMQLTKRD